VLGPVLDAIDEAVVQPVKRWLVAKAGKWRGKQVFKCLLRMLIAGAASACA
jgi:hypothetical protein